MGKRIFLMMFVLSVVLSIVTPTSKVSAKSVTIVPLSSTDLQAKDFPFVGQVLNNGGYGSMGSGTIIGDGSYVLTAKHVLSEGNTPSSPIYSNDKFLFIHEGIGYPIREVWTHKYSDLAILKLPVRLNTAVKIRLHDNAAFSEFYGAGYGKSCTDPKHNHIVWDVSYGHLRIFKNTMLNTEMKSHTSSEEGGVVYTEKVMKFMLHNPTDPTENSVSGEGMFGPGDSGGGIFVVNEKTKVIEQVAVIMAIGMNDRIHGVVTNVVHCKNWIEGIAKGSFSEPEKKQEAVEKSNIFVRDAVDEVRFNVIFLDSKKRRIRAK